MPSIAAVAKIELPHKISQQEVKEQAQIMFSKDFPQTNRLIFAFDNTEIITRNFCKPLSFYTSTTTLSSVTWNISSTALEYSVQAVEEAVKKAGIDKMDITDVLFVSTSGLATPSMDAHSSSIKCG